MILFVLWQDRPDSPFPEPEAVRGRFQEIFGPLFKDPLETRVFSDAGIHMVFAALAVRDWRPKLIQRSGDTMVFGITYPLNAHAALRPSDPAVPPLAPLPAAARALARDPEPLLERLDPPFLMAWTDGRQAFLQNDGLGRAQCFEYESKGFKAWSNRVFAFKALGADLVPDPEEWTAKAALGWFPLQMSGFKHVRFLKPGTQLRIGRTQVEEKTMPVLRRWVAPRLRSNAECLDLARQALIDHVRATSELSERFEGGLSGGYDSRAVFSTYRHLGLPIRARVKGSERHFDVVVSRELARIAGIPLRLTGRQEFPPEDIGQLRGCVEKALVWQAGGIDNKKHKSFLSPDDRLSFEPVNVMGQDGEVGRSKFQQSRERRGLPPVEPKELTRLWLTENIPPSLDQAAKRQLGDIVDALLKQAEDYDIAPERHYNFMYLYERSRRYTSGSIFSQTGIVLTPFQSVDFIRAVFSYRGDDLKSNVIPKEIIARNAPDWVDVPYAADLRLQYKRERKRQPPAPSAGPEHWKQFDGISRYYNNAAYWRQVGRPLFEAAVRSQGFWSEVFDPALARGDDWPEWADEVVLLSILEEMLGGVSGRCK